MGGAYEDREQTALRELGHTTVRPAIARMLTGVFVAVVALVPGLQHVGPEVGLWSGPRSALAGPCLLDAGLRAPISAGRVTSSWSALLDANRQLRTTMQACEDALEDASPVRATLRPWAQYASVRWLGTGNEQAYVGTDGWLFFRPDVDYVIAPDFLSESQRRPGPLEEAGERRHRDPLSPILAFHRDLEARGIRLIVMPTPVKPTVHPERLTARDGGWPAVPVQNPGFARFVAELERRGVQVLDVAPDLVDAARRTGLPQFLATDTHWRPDAVRRAAERARTLIRSAVDLEDRPDPGYVEHPRSVRQRGDIVGLLGLPPDAGLFDAEEVEIREIRLADGATWQPDSRADVLLLGDSFTNVFSLGELGWGEGAGFAEQLAWLLGRPIDRIAQNDAGAYATRERLARELAVGRDRLAGKRVVIWQFAARELTSGDWRPIPLEVGTAAPGRFVVPSPGTSWRVRGRVADISGSPRPGTVPYRDHILAIHLVDLESPDADVRGAEALVYMWSMRDNVRTEAAGYRPGQVVELVLRPWVDVARDYDQINRSELDSVPLLLEEPCWGEPPAGR